MITMTRNNKLKTVVQGKEDTPFHHTHDERSWENREGGKTQNNLVL